MLKTYIELIRLKHWVKNFFLLTPLFFAQKFSDSSLWIPYTLGFFGFCFLSSSVYVINDWVDRYSDAMHPHKKDRQIASGKINANQAHTTFAVCLLLFWLCSLFLSFMFFMWGIIYLLINLLYTIRLKKIEVLDALLIISGFVIRVYAGGAVGNIPITIWLVLITAELSMLLVFGKRKGDITSFARDEKSIYTPNFLNAIIVFACAALFVSYFLYTISDEVQNRIHASLFFLSVIPLALGLLRYLQIVFKIRLRQNFGGQEHTNTDPIKLIFSDLLLQLSLFTWIACVTYFVYFNRSF